MITVYGFDEGTRKEKGQKGTTGEPRFCRSFAKALVAAAGLDKGSNDTVPERVYRGLPLSSKTGCTVTLLPLGGATSTAIDIICCGV